MREGHSRGQRFPEYHILPLPSTGEKRSKVWLLPLKVCGFSYQVQKSVVPICGIRLGGVQRPGAVTPQSERKKLSSTSCQSPRLRAHGSDI